MIKVYFIKLVLKIKYVVFEDKPNFLYKKICRTVKEFFYQKFEKRILDDFLRKLRTTSSIERTVMIDFKMCCLYIVF